MSTIQIKINTVDKSSIIDWTSVSKKEVLTKEPDTLEFVIKNYPTKTYLPSLGDDVKMYDNSTLIFAGIVVEIQNDVEGLLKKNKILCKDYTHLADQKLVSKTYSSTTAQAIAQDIVSTFCPAGFTSNVIANVPIDSIVFNYINVSQALQKLISAMGGGYDYYFDYNKCLQFFAIGYYSSPFALTDTSKNYDWQSLSLMNDVTQLRNKITVRGGTTVGTSVTNQKVADGKQVIYFVGYTLTSLVVSHAPVATPTVFTTLNVGADGKDNPASFDCLYNPDSGLLIFQTAYTAGDIVKFTGVPSFPVIVQLQDDISIASYGTYEYLVTDKTIITKNVARSRALAMLLQYSQPLVTGSFNTRTSGLKAGQVISISSAIRGINGSYKIQEIETIMRTPSATTTDLIFKVKFVSTQTLTMNDVLKKLLITDVSDQVVVGMNEIVDTVYSENETITISDSIVISLAHNVKTETITIGESVTVQSLNYPVVFCAGIIAPTGYKRQFILNGSILG